MSNMTLPSGLLDLDVLSSHKVTENVYGNVYTCVSIPKDRVGDLLKGKSQRASCSFICREKHDNKKVNKPFSTVKSSLQNSHRLLKLQLIGG